MSSRHTRRKAAKLRAYEKLLGLAQAQRSANIAAIVKANKSSPIERNYYPESPMGRLGENAARAIIGGHSTGVKYADKSRPPRWRG